MNEEQFKQPGELLALWTGVLAGPLVWAADQQARYFLATYACTTARLVLHLLTLISLLLIAGAAFAVWRSWRRAGGGWPDSGGGAVSRSRFMAVTGLLLCALFALLVIAQWLPAVFYSPCERNL